MSDPDYDLLNSQSRALLSNEADAHNFTGHITCDPDIDSPIPDRFTAADQVGLEKLCETFCEFQRARDRFI